MPSQHPQQVRVAQVHPLAISVASADVHGQEAVFGIVGIVVEACDLQWLEWNVAGGDAAGGGLALALERNNGDRGDAVGLLDGGDDRAEINRLAEGEIIGIEERVRTVGQRSGSEQLQDGLSNVSGKVAGLRANIERQLERDIDGRVDFDIVAHHAVVLEPGNDGRCRSRVDGSAALRIDRDVHGVPAAGPSEGADSILKVGIDAHGHRAVIGGRDGSVLDVEGVRSAGAHGVEGLGIETAGGGKRICNRYDDISLEDRIVAGDAAQRVHTYVRHRAAAHAILRVVDVSGDNLHAEGAVAEPQAGGTVVFGLCDEVFRVGAAFEQIEKRQPDVGTGFGVQSDC